MFQKFQTTNQASLDWLKEFPKKYIPFLDFHWEIRKSSAQQIRKSHVASVRCLRFLRAARLHRNYPKKVPRTHIQYVLINTIQLYIYIIYNYIHQTQDLRSALCLNLRFTNKQYRIGSTCRPPRTKDSPRDSL